MGSVKGWNVIYNGAGDKGITACCQDGQNLPGFPTIGVVAKEAFTVYILQVANMLIEKRRRHPGHNIVVIHKTVGVD